MRIDDQLIAPETAWAGDLVPTGKLRAGPLPRISFGKPAWWSDEAVLGPGWVRPAGKSQYGLARFSFSLRPDDRQTVERAELTIALRTRTRGEAPIVFDLFPRAGSEDQTSNISLALGPTFKLGPAEASLGQIGTTINLKRALPVVTADGLGETTARWVFQSRSAHPLNGSQSVYLVVEQSEPLAGLMGRVEFQAEVRTHFGLLRALVPESERHWLEFELL